MTRLLVHVEGQTEETFVNEVLAPHLYQSGFTNVSARLMGAARARKRRGGICSWDTARKEIYNHLAEDGGAYATTIVDYYALPSGEQGWPGRETSAPMAFNQKAPHLCASLRESFADSHPDVAARFIPFVAMHEFEGLLFSDPTTLAYSIGEPALANHLTDIRGLFETPEHINDSPQTAPSKRLLSAMPGYQKVLHGNMAIIDIGLTAIREVCPLFDGWLQSLEAIP